MHVLKLYPQIVKHVAFHEPPINTFLKNRRFWHDKNEEIVRIAFEDSMSAAMTLFGETLNISTIDKEAMSKAADDKNNEMSNEQFEAMQYWFKYEIRQYTSSDIKLEDFKPYLNQITLFNGTDAKGSFPQNVNQYIADQLNLDIIDIPGGHLGYVQQTHEFANVLLKTWN